MQSIPASTGAESDTSMPFSQVLPNVYLLSILALSACDEAASEAWLMSTIQTFIYLRHEREWPSLPYATSTPALRRCRLANHADEDAVSDFKVAVDTLADALKEGHTVAICDITGTSRCPAVLVGYLFRYQDKTMKEALDMVVAAHPTTSLSHDILHVLLQCEFDWKGHNGLTVDEIATYAPTTITPFPDPAACSHDEAVRRAMLKEITTSARMDWQDATLIGPGIWIGNVESAWSSHWVKLHNITAVVNCAVECSAYTEKFKTKAGIADYCTLKIVEDPRFPARDLLKVGADFVHKARCADKNVLVHCWMGINRSVSTVLAYMMMYLGIPLLDSLYFVKQKRKCACPNEEMYPHLLALELEVFGRNTITEEDLRLR